ncbi:G-type lectin S-receptor-like serine/threonine-protein kinase RLK1 [Linum grandiflorum]
MATVSSSSSPSPNIHPFFLLLLLLLLPLSAVAQNITVGDSLTAAENSTSWLSPFGEFAFGFLPLAGNNTSFLLCTYYARIPDRTIVWYANGNSPAPAGSTAQLTSASGIILRDPQGSQLWRSGELTGGIDSASLTDAGNFVIRSRNSSPLWETFRNPTDTILPSQTLDKGVLLSSRRSDSNFSKGRFRLELQDDGNLVLTTVNLPTEQTNDPPYYASATDSGSSRNPGKQLVFDNQGFLYLSRENSSENLNLTGSLPPSSPNGGGFYHRVVLSFDGILTQYYYPKSGDGSSSWTHLWNQPENICFNLRTGIGSGPCGFNSVCNLESEGKPRCECPTGYSLMDPGDSYGNCRANYTQGCEEDNGGVPIDELYGFEEMRNTDWPTSDYALLQPFTEEQCRQSCLNDCMCAVAIFRSGDMCWKKKLPLSNGRLDPGLNGKALLKVRRGEVGGRNGSGFPVDREVKYVEKKDRERMITVGSVLLGFSTFLNVVLVVAVCFGFHFVYRRKKRRSPISAGDSVMEPNLMCFQYADLEEATNGFEEELGRGAFGVVYKGELENGVLVAVKKLNSFGQDNAGKEFKNEVTVIGQTHHRNLVRLIGYCEEGKDRQLLVYEFLSNGTLADYLFREVKPSWGKRIQIALGIARGILYLHEECTTQVIHCDIKPQNILLDDHHTARISDFGLAKLLVLNQSQTQTAIRGTKGYVAPEWFRNSPVTTKVDVYSFGVLLLEIISCRKSVDANESSTDRAILTYWAYDRYCEGAFGDLVEYDMEAMSDGEKLEKYVKIAIWCIQEDPSVRPTMKQVWQMLEGVTEVLVPPCPTPYTVTITKDV